MAQKWRMLLLIWLMMFVAYLDRINISIAGPTIMKSLHISPALFGGVLSAFTFGYAILQIPGGILADKFGAKKLLVIALLVWSVFTGLTGLATTVGVLIVVRVLFGVGEGLENGAQFKLIGDFFDSKERSAANGIFLTSIALGPAFVAPVAVWLLRVSGWHGMFLWFVIPGLIMAVLLAWLVPNTPKSGTVHTAVVAANGQKINLWSEVLGHPSIWLSFFGYLFFNVAFWGFLGWMPSYLSQARGISLAKLGFDASAPYILGFFGLLIIGWLGNKALFKYRGALIAVSYLLSGVSLYFAYSSASVAQSVIFLSIAGFFLYGGFGPLWAVSLDLIPDHLRGTMTGFVNFGGQIGGFFAPLVVGIIVTATKSYTGGFLFMIGGVVLAAIAFLLLQGVQLRARRTPASTDLPLPGAR